MNILIDCLPDSVEIGGAEYPINYGFRTSILFELLMMDSELTKEEKIIEGLRLYYPEIPKDIEGAVTQMCWFYSCGKPPKEKERYGGKPDLEDEEADEDEGLTDDGDDDDTPENNIYSFEHDAPYIYAAFMGQYGIDLADLEDTDLHWWKFRAMFLALDEKCLMSKIMHYRGTKITKKMSDEQKAYYRKMQKIYALPKSEAEEEKEDAIISALLNGGSVSDLL